MNKFGMIVTALAASLALSGTAISGTEAKPAGNQTTAPNTAASADQNTSKKAENNVAKPDAKAGNVATTAKADTKTTNQTPADSKATDAKK